MPCARATELEKEHGEKSHRQSLEGRPKMAGNVREKKHATFHKFRANNIGSNLNYEAPLFVCHVATALKGGSRGFSSSSKVSTAVGTKRPRRPYVNGAADGKDHPTSAKTREFPAESVMGCEKDNRRCRKSFKGFSVSGPPKCFFSARHQEPIA